MPPSVLTTVCNFYGRNNRQLTSRIFGQLARLRLIILLPLTEVMMILQILRGVAGSGQHFLERFALSLC